MPKLQHVAELDRPPVVGSRYLVPTVLYPWYGRVEAWPVMGPKHTDAEHIGFHQEHFHVDLRFLSDAQIRRIERLSHGRGIEGIVASAPLATVGLGGKEQPHPDPVEKRLTCRRSGHDYPVYEAREQRGLRRLAEAYAGRKCGRNAAGALVCPHKGFVLGSLEPDARGRVVCPLHGLEIDTRTGTVVGGTDAAASRCA
ncbi:Rieske 2Fe-2S domain-containing protein [Methylobacterium radiotolerans]